MNSGRILWVAGAYFAGVSFTFLIVKLKGSSAVAAAAARDRSEADAHILIRDHIGVGWMVHDVPSQYSTSVSSSVS